LYNFAFCSCFNCHCGLNYYKQAKFGIFYTKMLYIQKTRLMKNVKKIVDSI